MSLTQVQPGMLGTPQPYSFKNRIINGNMVIDQRNAGASIATPNGYTLDRFRVNQTTTGKLTAQQNQGSVTPPVGFSNYLGITSSSAYSVAAGDAYWIDQPIEGFNFSDLNWGTANAKTVTLSFQVYSSLTGTFGGSLRNSAANRSYPFSYSVPVANTWTTVSITIAGDTTGTWVGATNGVGVYVGWGLGVGSTYNGTAGSWSANNYLSATGATSVVGTNGATFYITCVLLEVGSSATGFDYRQYGTELSLCQRYYFQISNNASYTNATFANGTSGGGTNWFNCNTTLPVTMRTIPSISASTASQFSQGIAYVGVVALTSGPTMNTGNSSPYIAQYYWGTNSLGSAGQSAVLQSNTATYTYLGFSAEL